MHTVETSYRNVWRRKLGFPLARFWVQCSSNWHMHIGTNCPVLPGTVVILAWSPVTTKLLSPEITGSACSQWNLNLCIECSPEMLPWDWDTLLPCVCHTHRGVVVTSGGQCANGIQSPLLSSSLSFHPWEFGVLHGPGIISLQVSHLLWVYPYTLFFRILWETTWATPGEKIKLKIPTN